MGAAFVVFLAIQFKALRYVPWIYWTTVVLISVFGTLITDNLTDGHGVPTTTTTPIFAALLAVSFLAWYLVERTLSIHTIRTPRREAFYWLAILFTFALGTAGGDMLSEQLGFGYLTAVLIFAGAIKPVGLVVTSFVCFMVSALGSHETRWGETAIVGVLLTAFCVGLFQYGLGLSFELWPEFMR